MPDREKVEAKIRELKSAMNGDNVQQIRSLISDLQQVTMAIGQAMYQGDGGSGGSTGPRPDRPTSPNGEDVVEGEYRQV